MNCKKNIKNYRNKLFLSALALIISLIVSISSVFAWFNMNTNTKLYGFNLNIQSNSVINATINTYAISEINEVESQKTYILALNQSNLIPLFFIPSFDFKNISYSLYKPAIAININFTLTIEAEFEVIAKAQSELITIGENNFLSNCAQFITVNYNYNEKSLTSYNSPVSFVSLQQTELSKVNTIQLLQNTITDGSISLWFVLEYNIDVLQEIHNKNFSLNKEFIIFSNDISLEIK